MFALDPQRALTQYLHRIWQTRQGLPPATIRSIYQTADGYLWLGTENGLVRFDGVRFVPVEAPGGPAGQQMWVRSLVQDSRQDIWIATSNQGLFRLRDGVFTRFSQQDGLPSDSLACLVQDTRGDLWACAEGGVARIHDGRIQAFSSSQGAIENASSACVRADGTVWFGGDQPRLFEWNGTRFVRHPLRSLSRLAVIQAMLSDSDGSIWVGTSEGLVRLKDGREERIGKAGKLGSVSVLSLGEGRDGSVWVGTTDGFSRVNNGNIESFRTQDGLSQSTVYAVFEDRERSLWVGTKRGLNQFMDRRTIPFTTSEGLPSNDTGPILQDSHGNTWVGTLGAGLARFDGRHSEVWTARRGLSSDVVRSLAEDENGIWVGADAGLDLLRSGRIERTITKRDGLPAGAVRALLHAGDGTLWIGTSAGLAVLRGGRIEHPRSAAEPGGAVAAMTEAGDRVLVAIEGSGIGVYEKGSLNELPGENVPLRDASAFLRDKEGSLWIGTTGSGLYLLNGRKLLHFSVKDGLFDDEIYGIAEDGSGRLWMACSKGLFSVKRQDLLQFAAGALTAVVSTPYSPLDGLQTVECRSGVQPAVWRMQNRNIAFSTIHGLLVVDPDHMAVDADPPPVAIESVAVDGRSQRPSDLGRLSPGVRNLAFTYTGLSFRSPGRITFHYMLEGFDQDWIDAGVRREAYYTNLPPGNYRFRVTACNPDGACNQTPAMAGFNVPARLYQRSWFWVAAACLILLLGRLGYRLRIRQLEQRFDAVLGERNRIARELHDTLIQGFSGVTMEMQALATRLPENHRDALGDIIHDAAACLGEARRSVADLRGAAAGGSGLAAAIESGVKQTATNGARLQLCLEQIPRGLPAHVEYNLLRIALEAVANSARHSGARTIEVVLRAMPDLVRLSVRDDGSGFHGGDTDSPAGHYGLTGMRERAQDIGAEFRLMSRPGSGTLVSVDLPVRRTGAGIRPSEPRQNVNSE